jgi:hypothetical protein
MPLTAATVNGARTLPGSPGGTQARRVPANPLASFGIGVLLLYLFLVMSRVFDMLPFLGSLRIPMILMVLLLLITILSGQFMRSLSTAGTRLMLALLAWAAVSSVFSVWRRGSLDFLKDLSLSVVVFVAIVSLVRTVSDLRKVVAVQLLAITVASLMSFVSRGEDTRLALAGGSYGDPNGFAAAILQAIPLCFMFHDRLHGPFTKLIAMSLMLPMLVAFLRTGSRGGMIAFLLVGVLVFLRVGVIKKVLLLAVGALVGVGMMFFLPESLRVRYMTLFGSPAAVERTDLDLGGASSSSEARLALLRLSVVMTFRNPVFGVGPGMFPVAGDMAAKEDGQRRGTWQVTHNTYTQVSSELGFPGLFLFLGLMWQGWRGARAVSRLPAHGRNQQLESLSQIGAVLQLSFFGFAISVFFLSLFYWMTWGIVIASMICIERLVQEESRALAENPGTAAPVPNRPFGPGMRKPLPGGQRIG